MSKKCIRRGCNTLVGDDQCLCDIHLQQFYDFGGCSNISNQHNEQKRIKDLEAKKSAFDPINTRII